MTNQRQFHRRWTATAVFMICALVVGTVPASGIVTAATDGPVARCDLSQTQIAPGESVTLDASDSENATAYRYDKRGNGEFGPWREEETRTFTYEEAGTYEPKVQVRSPADYTDTASCGELTVDANTPPTASFSFSPSEPAPGETVSFTSESSDSDGSIVHYLWTVDGEPVGESPTLEYSFQETGDHVVSLEVIDDDDATDTVNKTVTVRAENQPPTVDLTYTPSKPKPNEQVNFTAEASDQDGEVSRYEWYVDGELIVSTPDALFSHSFETTGNHTVEVVAEDDDGATAAATVTVSVVQETNEPPAVDVTHSPEQPTAGETVTFEAEATDPDGDVGSYEWTVDGELAGEGSTLTYTFEDGGEYIVEVVVTDDDGATATAEQPVEVLEPTPTATPTSTPTATPTASETPTGPVELTADWWTIPLYPQVGETTTLLATGPTDPRITYQWDLNDDGNFEKQGKTITHAFGEAGAKNVTLQALGPDGKMETRTATVSILAASNGSSAELQPIWTIPSAPRPGETVTLVADPAAFSGTVDAHRWDFDEDGTPERKGRVVTYTFPGNGTHSVTLEVDQLSGQQQSVSTTVSTTGEPVEDGANRERGPSIWTIPMDPQPGHPVTLVADPATPSDEVDAYRWDLDGEGEAEAEGQVVTHSFTKDGTFSVSLTVERSNGSSVTVEDVIAVGNATVGTASAPSTSNPTEAAETTDAAGSSPIEFDPVILVAGIALVVMLTILGLFRWRRANQ